MSKGEKKEKRGTTDQIYYLRVEHMIYIYISVGTVGTKKYHKKGGI